MNFKTQHGKHLKVQADFLKENLLDFPDDDYSIRILSSLEAENQLKLRAFRVFMHAEVECYLESHAGYIVDYAYDCYKKDGAISHVISTLCQSGPLLKVSSSKGQCECDRITEYYDKYKALIRDNHGIGKDYFESLFYPLAVDVLADWNDLVVCLNSFARSRGGLAHGSYTSAIQTPLMKKNQLDESIALLSKLAEFDNDIDYLHCYKYYYFKLKIY